MCGGGGGGVGTVGNHVVLFALNANFLNRALVLSALVIVSQAWSTIKKTIDFLMKSSNTKK